MSLKPRDGKINIGGTDLIVADIKYQTDVLFFDRVEFSNSRQREVSESSGAKAVFVSLPGGMIAQLVDGCVTSTPRPLTPDDYPAGNYDKLHRRFDIKRWIIEGGSTPASNIDTVYGISVAHKVLLDLFEAHQSQARSEISIGLLQWLQTNPVTFSYLTATSLSITGMPLGSGTLGTISNALIVNFNPDVDYEESLNSAGTLSRVMRRWAATIEIRVEVPALSTSVPSF